MISMFSEITDMTETRARERHRGTETANSVPGRGSPLDWLPLITAPPAVIAFRDSVDPWVFMWLLAFSIYFACKWFTWRRADKSSVVKLRSLAYLLVWPGMDAGTFFNKLLRGRVSTGDWFRASARMVVGAGLFWLATSEQVLPNPLLAGWMGMVGAILFLHFGAFHFLALGFNTAGIAVKPVMCKPTAATSLADFWGRRWNTAFNTLVHDFVFRPLSRRAGPAWATLLVFLVSGLIHDAVISLPARGGYGTPTAYFLLQGVGVLFERTHAGIALGLGRRWRGRLFLFAVACLPLPWLFHSAFVQNVILPMLKAVSHWRAL